LITPAGVVVGGKVENELYQVNDGGDLMYQHGLVEIVVECPTSEMCDRASASRSLSLGDEITESSLGTSLGGALEGFASVIGGFMLLRSGGGFLLRLLGISKGASHQALTSSSDNCFLVGGNEL
jgi:hypothetical protein